MNVNVRELCSCREKFDSLTFYEPPRLSTPNGWGALSMRPVDYEFMSSQLEECVCVSFTWNMAISVSDHLYLYF